MRRSYLTVHVSKESLLRRGNITSVVSSGSMRALDRVIECLRPLVESNSWDYCVVWKIGNDPTRFIEWMDCCCGGAHDTNIKEEKGKEKHLLPTCKDEVFRHPIRTKACEALANLPHSIPLYSGIHGEVLISAQPRWISLPNAPASNPLYESVGTRVLIPVAGGLIELFASKHIPTDQDIIEFVMAHCNISLEQEITTVGSYNSSCDKSIHEQQLHPVNEEFIQDCLPPINHFSFTGKQNFLLPRTHYLDYNLPSFQGSLSGSIYSDNHSTLNSEFDRGSKKIAALKRSDRISGRESFVESSLIKQEMELVSVCGNRKHRDKNSKVCQRLERDQYQSKNLIIERNRRNRIRDKLYELRSMVPKISKMDKASILGDAAEYIGDLQQKLKNLQGELMEMEAGDCNSKNSKIEIQSSNGVAHGKDTTTSSKITLKKDLGIRYSTHTEQNQASSSTDNMERRRRQMEVQIEVNEIGKNELLVKFICEQNQRGFTRLMEAMNSLKLQVIDANVTTFRGKVLNILKLEMATGKNVKAQQVRDSLLKLSCNWTVDGVPMHGKTALPL